LSTVAEEGGGDEEGGENTTDKAVQDIIKK